MPAIRFRNKEEYQEWQNVIEHFESVASLATQENKQLKDFCRTQLQTAQFWKRYAMEGTNDSKLRDIAQNSLQQVETGMQLADTSVPPYLEPWSKSQSRKTSPRNVLIRGLRDAE